ncbi:MAG: tRNA pseudouridine(38-40) synthase TruA [Chloroflexota bacterium]
MARYQIIIAYDGTHFQGFQRQGSSRTVQAEVEAALRSLGWQGESILYAGRTDSGVHARGQVIAFDMDWRHTPQQLLKALNASLPEDVAASRVQIVRDDFHPRYDALARQYLYRLYCQEERDPLRERFQWRVWPPVQGELLHQTAGLLPGEHDFAAFGSPLRPGGSTIRTVYRAEWQQTGEQEWIFRIAANAFLYRMVRRLVFLQVRVGQQKLSLQQFENALKIPQPLMPGLAKPNGLVLEWVQYEENDLKSEGLNKTLSVSGEEDCG